MAEIVKELSPESPAGEYLGVEVLLTIGRHSEAFKLYSGAKSAYPEHVETDAFEARLWSEVDPMRSLKAAQAALSKGYPLQELSAWIGNAIIKSVGEEDSGDALSKFAEVYPDRWIWHRAAMAYVEEKSLDKARRAFEKAIQLGNLLESELQLAIIEYQDLEMHESAVKRLERLNGRVRTSKTLGNESLALVETHLSFAHLAAKSVEKAQTHASNAMNLSVNNEARVNQIIDTFKNENKLNVLAPQLMKLVLNNPLLEEAHLALAIVSTQAKNYAATVEHLSAAIALAPERDDLYSARGQALYLDTQYETALQDFEHAIKQKPDYAPYHYNKACLLSLLGRKSEAFESLKTALIINQSLREQAVDDSDLDNLRFDQEYETRLAQLGINASARILNRKKSAPQSQPLPEATRRDVIPPVQVRTDKLDE
jgi:tetratricopeptide (TPR) repeat protein